MRYYNIPSILLLVLLVVAGSSCDRFLEEKSQDLFVPKSVQDFEEFFLGEALNQGPNNQFSIAEFLDIMTDDVNEYINLRRKDYADYREMMWGYYTWQQEPELDYNNTLRPDRAWEAYYHRILLANIILNQLDEIQGAEVEKQHLAGECYFLRAWSYFQLVNMYAVPYENEEQAKTTEAIPVNDEVDVKNQHLPNVSLYEIYQRIEANLASAEKAFRAGKTWTTIYRPGLNAVLLLQSRVYLYKKEYDKVITTSTQLIDQGGVSLYNMSSFVKNSMNWMGTNNPEIIFCYGSGDNAYKLDEYIRAGNTDRGTYVVAPELYALYEKGDMRVDAFFTNSKPRIKPNKYYQYRENRTLPYGFRLAEAYLNRAEAYAEKGETDKAMADLNTLLDTRLKVNPGVSAQTQDEAVELVRVERRKELCFEGHRWFDLRRWGMPALEHKYSSSVNPGESEIMRLEQGDRRYTLPVPRNERNL